LIGTTLDKYEVLQKVGEGGMATVYRGRHSTLDRTVAIKILHPHLSSSTRNRTRFAREVKAIERLRHENILEVFDYSGSEVSDCYIVTEFVDGATLTSLLGNRGRLPSEVVSLIGMALCRALGYAHTQGVLHRDVKTDNIMVRTDGTVKLMDFGIARFLDESKVTMTGALVGSPAFMSPEQAKEAPLDLRSDLFALGTVLFYLVTGHLPFTGSNPSLILKNVIEGNRQHVAELAPTMSASLADVIERLMATSADDRFVTAGDAERHLRATLDETQIDPELVGVVDWSLAAWMDDPEGYETRLDEHLRRILVEEGRRLLSAGDHLAALRLLNRLLSMDEDNPEVLALVQGLHGEPAPATGKHARVLAGLGLAVLGAGMIAMFVAARVPSETAETPSGASAPVEASVDPLEPPSEAREADAMRAVLAPPEREPPPPEPEPAPAAPRRVRNPAPRPAPPAVIVEEPPEEAGTAEDVELGTVWINAGEYVADVYYRDRKIGRSRSDIRLPVGGPYDLELRAQVGRDLFFPEWVQVTVLPGVERTSVAVELRLKPGRVDFPRSLPAACEVAVNGAGVGTVGALGWRWEEEHPDREVTVRLWCPDGRQSEHRWPSLTQNVVFPALAGTP
jgi:eukaryotic-like serine/threonine-protein kinase